MRLSPTANGLDFLAQSLAGGPSPNFSKITYGNGADAGAEAKEMSNPLVDMEISSYARNGNFVDLECSLNNSTIEEGFTATELGVYIVDPYDESGEGVILFAYGYDNPEEATYIPAYNLHAFETHEVVKVFVGSTENVSAVLNESMVYVNKSDFEKHIQDKNNPHEVDKEQVGLSNVPNVTTNDQTPTFEEAKELENLTSGEKLSLLFGKISKAVRTLIDHVSNKNNPHNVTAEQADAAKRIHQHSAIDITSGTLSPERGGTGCTSMNAFISKLGDSISLPVIGSYVGDGDASKIDGFPKVINLGFSPSAVMVINSQYGFVSAEDTYGGFATKEYNAVSVVKVGTIGPKEWHNMYTTIQIVPKGFRVNFNVVGGANTNEKGKIYHYIAFR